MSSGDSVDSQIEKAINSGELTPTIGVGGPIEDLDNDPLWWVRSLIRREKASGRLSEVLAHRDQRLAIAVDANELSDARMILRHLSRELTAWNNEVGEEHQIEIPDEIWLVTERASARR